MSKGDGTEDKEIDDWTAEVAEAKDESKAGDSAARDRMEKPSVRSFPHTSVARVFRRCGRCIETRHCTR